MRGKQGKGGVHVVKTHQVREPCLPAPTTPQAVILGLYEDPVQPAEAATVTESLGDYLKGVGY